VCDHVSAEEIATLTGRAVDEAEDTAIGFRGECTYSEAGAIQIVVAAQRYGSEIDFGFNDYADHESATPLDGVGDRAATQNDTFNLVIASGEYVVLVGVRGDQPDADGYRAIGIGVLEQLAPALT